MSNKKGSETTEEEKNTRTKNLTQEIDYTFDEFEEKLKAWRNSEEEKNWDVSDACPSDIMKEFQAIRNATQARMSKMKDTCAYCGSKDTRYKKCAGCKAASYCSIDCQKLDWKSGHKKSCLSVKRKQSKGAPPKITKDLNLIGAINMHMDNVGFVEKCVEKFKAGNEFDSRLIDILVTLFDVLQYHQSKSKIILHALEGLCMLLNRMLKAKGDDKRSNADQMIWAQADVNRNFYLIPKLMKMYESDSKIQHAGTQLMLNLSYNETRAKTLVNHGCIEAYVSVRVSLVYNNSQKFTRILRTQIHEGNRGAQR